MATPTRAALPDHRRARRRRTAVVVLLVAAGAAGAFLRPVQLGLDLRGGTQIVLEAQATEVTDLDDDVLDRTVEVLRRPDVPQKTKPLREPRRRDGARV